MVNTPSTLKKNCFCHLLFNPGTTSVHLFALLNHFLWCKGYLAAAWQLRAVGTSGMRDTDSSSVLLMPAKNRLCFHNYIMVYIKPPIQFTPKRHKKIISSQLICSSGANWSQPRTKGLIWPGATSGHFLLQKCESEQTPHLSVLTDRWGTETKMQRLTLAYTINGWCPEVSGI